MDGRSRYRPDSRGTRTDTCPDTRGSERAWTGAPDTLSSDLIDTPALHAAAGDSHRNPIGAPSRTTCEATIPSSAFRVSTMWWQCRAINW